MITEDVYIKPDNLNGDIDKIILKKLQSKYEGYSRNEGYVLKDSIQLIEKKLGRIKTINNKSMIIFNVIFKSEIISPNDGDIINCKVENINKMGLLEYLDSKELNSVSVDTSPLLIIIPNNKEISKYTPGDKLKVKVLAKRIKHKSTFIQIIGDLVE